MLNIRIDGKGVTVAEGTTVLRAAEAAGIAIPHFCYHPAFPPEGSCRVCLVEIEGIPKLELACGTEVRDGMKVSTQSSRVREARRDVLEFLLAEHPLDCPICDKAGECRLQDYFAEYGLFPGDFREAKEKRDKRIRIGGKLLLDRERCILCTRCVRFLDRIIGTSGLGVINRGNRCEIAVHESRPVDTIYAGNLAEICPVGAITDADFRFKTRVWFLESRGSLCVSCSRGCNIWVDVHPGLSRAVRRKRVFRFRPRPNPDVNQYWMCDIGRAAYAAADEERHEAAFMPRSGRDLRLSWDKAFILISEKIKASRELGKTDRIAVVLNTGLTNEELFLCDRIFRRGLGLKNIFFADPPARKPDGFLFTGEMTANPRGAREVGFAPVPAGPEFLAAETELLLVFGTALAETAGKGSALEKAFSRIGTKVLFASRASSLDRLVDIVLPTAVSMEKNGSLTNINGRVQDFVKALEPVGECLAEWEILSRIGRELGLGGGIFEPPPALEKTRRAMNSDIPFFKVGG